MDIADKIKFLRMNVLNVSQENFAMKLNVTRSTIKNWETCGTKPTVSHIILISLLCDVTIDYLIFDHHPYEFSLNELNDEDYEILKTLILYLKNKKSKV